jgi:type I restriction enzyme S subunit
LQTKDLTLFTTGSTIPHIYFKDYADMPICVPSEKEQQKIAAFFSNIDKQIHIQEQCLEKVKQIKSACLDNMFV